MSGLIEIGAEYCGMPFWFTDATDGRFRSFVYRCVGHSQTNRGMASTIEPVQEIVFTESGSHFVSDCGLNYWVEEPHQRWGIAKTIEEVL